MYPPKKNCTHCGQSFTPKYANMRLCFGCFKKRDRALDEYDYLWAEVSSLRRELNNQQRQHHQTQPAGDTPDEQTLRWMIQKLHPDKHSNADHATKALQFLATFKRR